MAEKKNILTYTGLKKYEDELHEGEEKEVEVKGKPVALHRLHVGNRDTKGVKK